MIIERSGRLCMARCRLKMAPHLAPRKLVSSANVRMVEHHNAAWTLRFYRDTWPPSAPTSCR